MAINLEVNNLRISFRTNNGKVQAVRDISFNLFGNGLRDAFNPSLRGADE